MQTEITTKYAECLHEWRVTDNMAITNTTKPSTTLANVAKVSSGESWASVTTTWATETRSWDAISKLITNQARESSTITNTAKI